MMQTETVTDSATSGTAVAGSEERVSNCRAQAALYQLLGRCLEEEVDADLLQLLRSELSEPLKQLGVTFDQDFHQAPAETLLDDLAEEYTGLIVAPGGVNPYLSVFETGCMFREPCDEVANAYQEAGWDYKRRFSGEFPDHVGTMIAFVGRLFESEADALERGDEELAEVHAGRRKKFLLELLGPWAPGWCQRAAKAAFHVFYQQLFSLTEQLLWKEIEVVADRRKFKELADLNKREPKKIDYDADFRKASGV